MKKKRYLLEIQRCPWATEDDVLKKYHDEEWGVPVHDDKKHFEMLVLEGAQAGLNWLTILKKRDNYRRLFRAFDPYQIAEMSDEALEGCLRDQGIIRNRLKVYSVRQNAVAFIGIQKEYQSFDQYIWTLIHDRQIVHQYKSTDTLPSEIEESRNISKALKKRGMLFMGPKIIHAYMQAIGLVNGHTIDCFRHASCRC